MKITYVRHSCFTLEIEKTVLIFDYFNGKLPKFDRKKTICVFSSHGHMDHFNKKIFRLADIYENVYFILSDDIREQVDVHSLPLATEGKILYMGPDELLQLENMGIRTLQSTDLGVAFIIRMEGLSIYHGGDLHWWSWNSEGEEFNDNMKKAFLHEMDKIKGERFDVAFLPLDPRLQERYSWGFDYFMRNTYTELAIPMHFWNNYKSLAAFREMECAQEYRDKIMLITHREETLL
ncbi:MBL fold metallo-hydrolase [Parasporobacterium paucivorans]|uniref:L-ascorbate metabolism protein UlaG, beta-lactamase superfamily n=1 Tax=Parasporobacterium paucivorans DSM 15970 TaxID=1122934 RepID=A0A1M6D4C4_9FIRM|nr:MBL fold metallo-hydrolase [Parasporobacterium paucivorans]SHI68097.1 L-ascorbate metabolism protein UlaG, beta-lactamase superfamily [Parasporobacterium paucivorans DSM 15970]